MSKVVPFPRSVERRRGKRYRVAKQGRLLAGDGQVLEVSILNLSAGGACIEGPDTKDLPAQAKLVIVAEDLVLGTELRWRDGRATGLLLTGEAEVKP